LKKHARVKFEEMILLKISFNMMGCPDWSWEKIVDEACRLGYDGIEVAKRRMGFYYLFGGA
jgi:sugar phosphate isomerase/epimerase